MHQRTALRSRKSQLVQFLGERRFAENHSSARSAERLVRGCGDNLGMRNWAWMYARGYQPGNVRHVHEENRAHRLGCLPNALEIDNPRIGASPRHNHFRLMLMGKLFD